MHTNKYSYDPASTNRHNSEITNHGEHSLNKHITDSVSMAQKRVWEVFKNQKSWTFAIKQCLLEMTAQIRPG